MNLRMGRIRVGGIVRWGRVPATTYEWIGSMNELKKWVRVDGKTGSCSLLAKVVMTGLGSLCLCSVLLSLKLGS